MRAGLSEEQIILILSLPRATKETLFLKQVSYAFTLLIFQAFSGNL